MTLGSIARAERDGTRAENRFRLSPKRTSPFKSVGGASSVDCSQPRFAHQLNPLKAELNPICHLLALLGGATIVVVSRLRVNVG